MNPKTSELPRPEYPRPQFERQRWLNLNGQWEFAFDDQNAGLKDNWFDGRQLPLEITVPFPYQCSLSGIDDKAVHEIVWYARSLAYDPAWEASEVLLHFGAVDYQATVWLNGQEVGHNQGGHVPFSFDIAPYLRHGENRIALRVVDRNDPYQPRGKQSVTGMPKEIDYYCTTGIWQTVWLEPVPPVRIDRLRITPLVENSAFEVRVYMHGPMNDYQIQVDLLDGDETVASLSREVCAAAGRLFVPVRDAKLWSPESPNLYGMVVRLFQDGHLLDEVRSYGGLRSVEIRRRKLHINGRPCYLRMVLDQGYWPESYLAPPSDEALRKDVEATLALGFNGARKHQKIEDPRYLYWCDKLGLLVWAEMANARAWSQRTEEMLMAEWTRAVQRDFNHPSIVGWVPVNESMGFPDLTEGHPGQKAFIERIVDLTRVLDPDRPIVDNDGWEHTNVSDICAIHDYTPSGERLRERYRETIDHGELPLTSWLPTKNVFTKGAKYRNQPIMLTEVGGFLIEPNWIPEQDWDYLYDNYGRVSDNHQLLVKFTELLAGIASLPFVSGFCYTQLTDVEQELNGLLTYDRRPKINAAEVRAVQEKFFAEDGPRPETEPAKR